MTYSIFSSFSGSCLKHFWWYVLRRPHRQGTINFALRIQFCCRAKVCNFDHTSALVDQQILRFQVSVQHSPLVAKQNGNCHLVQRRILTHRSTNCFVRKIPGRERTWLCPLASELCPMCPCISSGPCSCAQTPSTVLIPPSKHHASCKNSNSVNRAGMKVLKTYETTLGCTSSLSREISRIAVAGMPSSSSARIFFIATISCVLTFLAL